MIDLAYDMIGRLGAEGKLTAQQVESARVFQERRALYVAELEVPGFKSCLAGGSGGYDGSDGNPEAVQAYNVMVERIGRISTACLVIECGKLTEQRPASLDALRNALNVLGEG
ncbi:hypothetical protein AB3Y40_06735 [Yoonia sp. R2331]|uniref:hypothetical protein n=1 Tax=Yoonia sp. R2331 TaxID=3237238 RepID=UPI0034E578C5